MSDRFVGLSPLQRAYMAIEELQSKLDASDRLRTEPIAIIGIGCRFPGGADSPASLWPLLRDGFDAIVEVPPDRWDIDAYYDPDPSKPGKMCTRWGGFLEGVDRFDAPFFNISPREAILMDPQQRLLLEVTWEALEDAGQPADRLAGSRTGVFMGIYNTDYAQFQQQDEAYAAIGNSLGIAVGRLSYAFDLQGPCMLVDTLCSSSLVAVSLACHSLRQRESNLALAGGVNLILSPVSTILSSRLLALAPDGRCKTFDARANGYVRGEGCGVIVLKRLSEALADGDPVYAVVRGAAVNQDGRSTALTAPNVLSQQAVIRQALADGGVTAEQVGYVEAHGTGTALGDPIEIEALRAVYGRPRPDASACAIASIKTNLGHTEAAAGIAGVIKAALALKHETIPPHLHLRELNPRIDLTGTPFVIPTTPRPFPAGEQGRFAGVSAFGLGGTNAHVVLQQVPTRTREDVGSQEGDRTCLLPLSARSPEAVRALAEAFHARLDVANTSLHDLCYTASRRRTHHDERVAVVGGSAGELQRGLKDYLARASVTNSRRTRLAFVFSGHGGHYPGMGRQLLQQEPVFRNAIEACDRALRSHVDWSLLDLLESEAAEWQQKIDQVQPASFSIQVALFELWRSWGIRPQAIVGHSMGEVAAAHAAGVLSLEHAVRVICRRSALLEGMRGRGATLVVDLPEQEVRQAIDGEKGLSVAASNGPRTTVVAGDADAITSLMGQLERQNVFCRRVQVDVAVHTAQMERLGPEIFAELDGVAAQPGDIDFYSSVHGRLLPGNQCGPAYWAENLLRPVQFWKAVQRLVEDGHRFFVEVSPHPVLGASIVDGLKTLDAEGSVRASLRRGEPERQVLLESLGALYEHGQSVAWQALYPTGHHVPLPAYPWQRERFWVDASANNGRWIQTSRPDNASGAHPLLGEHRELSSEPGTYLWEFEPLIQAWPYLSDHRVEGMVVVPAAVFVELALSGAKAVFGEGPRTIEQLRLHQMLVLREGERHVIQLIIARKHATEATFQFASREPQPAGGWTLHARGTLALDQNESAPPSEASRREIQERCQERVSASTFYQTLAAAGLEYGPAFQSVAEIWRRDGEALARLEVPAAIAADDETFLLHPALLDSCFQVFAGAMPRGISTDGALYLPVGAERIDHQRRRTTAELWVSARVTSSVEGQAQKVEGDLCVSNRDGHVIVDIRNFAVQRLALAAASADPIPGWLFTSVWRRQQSQESQESQNTQDRQNSQDRQDRAQGTAAVVAHSTSSTCVILGEMSDRTERLREALIARGDRCVWGSPDTLAELLREARNAPLPIRRVVYLAPERSDDADPVAIAQARCTEVLHLVQSLAQAGFRDAPRLWLVTRGTQAISPMHEVTGLGEAPLWGLARTIALEHPEFACSRIDLSPAPLDDEPDQLAREICAEAGEDQIALRSDGRYVARLVRRPEKDVDENRETLTPAYDRQFTLEIATPGILDNLALRAAPRRPPAAGEIEIEVKAAGLNFLDVLSAMGLRPGDDEAAVLLGGECAGVVSALGEGVREFRVGDSIIAIAPSSFGRYVTTPADFAAPKPDRLSDGEAATIPVAFLTAYYALHEVGRMQPGERILIHSASGGTGLAAVQLAQRAGAEIFATAGSPEKREFLRSLGISHVMDSRSLDFANEVLATTGGYGVDLVLNSLTGEAIDRSLSVLAPEGRFLEIGKKDIYQDYRLGLLPFRNGLSYFAIDLAGLALRRPKAVAALLRDLVCQFADGRLSPLPFRAYPISDAVSAFHTMAQAKHTGKLVLTLDEPAATPIAAAFQELAAIRSDGTYLITGGLGGVGLAIADWLVTQGARHLVLMGRSAPGEAAAATLDSLRTRGARIEAMAVDVAQRPALAEALTYVDANFPPLRGIVHAAAVLNDATLMRLDDANFTNVFAPKVAGAWNLHGLTQHHALDFFVLFSSAASVLGSPGQGNYTAANAFLDALAHYRQARGQTALSINWGPWAEVGLAAAQENRGQRLAALGIASISPHHGAETFGRLLADPSPQVAVMAFRLRLWRQLAPAAAAFPLFAELVEDTGGEEKSGRAASKLPSTLRAAEPSMRRALLEEHLSEQIAQVLRTSATRITRDTPFNTLGMDSLMGLELRNRLESSLGVGLQATLVWSHPTIATLVPHLAAKVGVSLGDEPTSPLPIPGAAEDDAAVDELSEHDASVLLAERLGALDDEYLS